MKQRWIAILMAVWMLVAMMPTVAFADEVSVDISGINSNRGAGQLIVYTDEYGDNTGTNQWGAEAVVGEDNRVQLIVTGKAAIPEGGFVVSGHDNEEKGGKLMKTWIRENIQIGDYVYADLRTQKLTVSDEPLPDERLSPFFSFDNPADSVNKERQDDGMVVYTPEYGETTGTNEYGYEVIVENDVVTGLGGNNSVIPKNGYVVSLHGSTARWMRVKILRGMRVEMDPQTLNVVFTYDADGLKQVVDVLLDKAQQTIEERKAAFVNADFDAAQAELDALRAAYTDAVKVFDAAGGTAKSELKFADACDDLMKQADTVCNALCDSYPVQYRGVWIRPSQKSAKEVEAYVKELHEACVNFVAIEGWFENGVIMEVPEGSMFGRHPGFNYDVLQAYIDACHKYGMECHLWMPIMCVGSEVDDGYEERSVLAQKPEWLSLNQYSNPYNKDGFMMVDPANEDAKEYFLDFYKYIVTNYDLDVFEMDYIRYYASSDQGDFGYTEAAFKGFEKAYGHGVEPKCDPKADYWEDWCQYRRDCVTGWVRDIRDMIRSEAPDVLLSADVAYPFEHALDAVYQDFPSWLEEGLIDMVHPMAYGDGYGDEIKKTVELAGDTCMVVTGLGAQVDVLGATELERQAREDNLYGAYGDCFFEAYAYLTDKVPDAVKKTVYRNEAITPFLDKDAAIRAMLEYMVARIDEIIVPLGGMTAEQAKSVQDAVAAAKDGVAEGRIEPQALIALREAIAAVENPQAQQVLKNDLYRAEQISCVYYHVSADRLTEKTLTAASGKALSPVWLWGGIALLVAVMAVVLVLFLKKARNIAKTDAADAT